MTLIMTIKNEKIKEIDSLVGYQIKKIRILSGFSQKDLAKKMNLSIQQIQKYENGKNRISVGTLCFFASFFKKNIHYFINSREYNQLIWKNGKEKKINLEIAKTVAKIKNKRFLVLLNRLTNLFLNRNKE